MIVLPLSVTVLLVRITDYCSKIRIIERIEYGVTACERSCSKVHIIFLLSLIFFILVLVPPTERSCAERYCCKHSFFSFRFCSFVVLSISYRLQQKYNRFFLFLCFSFCFSCLFLFFDYSIAHTLQQKYNKEYSFSKKYFAWINSGFTALLSIS